MWRLRLVRDGAPAAAVMDDAKRAAAIAAMAHRLAAAGPRTRQLLAAQEMPPLVAQREDSLAGPAAQPQNGRLDRARPRRNVVLGGFLSVSACAGFGLMLLTQSFIHDRKHSAQPGEAVKPISDPQVEASPAPEAVLPSPGTAAPPAVTREALLSETSTARALVRYPSLSPPATVREYAGTLSSTGAASPLGAPAIRRPALAMARHPTGRLPPLRAIPALYRLPQWLTEPHPPVVMSPPPHDLRPPGMPEAGTQPGSWWSGSTYPR